jgi:hypothetical protein
MTGARLPDGTRRATSRTARGRPAPGRRMAARSLRWLAAIVVVGSVAACVAGSPSGPPVTPGGGSHAVPSAPGISASAGTDPARSGATTPTASSAPPARSPAPSEATTPAPPEATPATRPSPSQPTGAPTPAGLPAAFLVGPIGEPVAGMLGSYTWDGVASDVPWLPASILGTVETSAGTALTLSVDGAVAATWTALAAPAGDGTAADPVAIGTGRGPGISFVAPGTGDLVVAVNVAFTGGGDATWSWHVVVR